MSTFEVTRLRKEGRLDEAFALAQAEYEAGFSKWMTHLARMSGQLGCRTRYVSESVTLEQVRKKCAYHGVGTSSRFEAVDRLSLQEQMSRQMKAEDILMVVSARAGAAVMAALDWIAVALYIYSAYDYVFSRAISGLDFSDPTMQKIIAFAVVMVVLTACSNALAWIPLHKKERIAVSDNTAAKETENGKIG